MYNRQKLSKWTLVGISSAAKPRMVVLKFGVNSAGKKRDEDIQLVSPLCSRRHCRLHAEEHELVLFDTSTNGTYVNNTRYIRNENGIHLYLGDIIGFGSRTYNYDPNDSNRYVYRVDERDETPVEIIELSDDDEDIQTSADHVSASLSNEDKGEALVSTEWHEPDQTPLRGQPDKEAWQRVQKLLMMKQKIADAQIVQAMPLRKRRQTMVDGSGLNTSLEHRRASMSGCRHPEVAEKKIRAAKLAQLGARDRIARDEAERIAAENRVQFVPKVKRTMCSRNEKLVLDVIRND